VRIELVGNHLELTATDRELTMRVTKEVTGSSDGVTVVPARFTHDIVRALEPGAVDVEQAGEEVRIASGRSRFSVRTVSADEFPRVVEPSEHAVVLDAKGFEKALDQVVRAASTDEARQILTGVLMTAEGGGLRLVATDSYRLAVRDLDSQNVLAEGQKVLVPSRALNELKRVLGGSSEVTLRLGERDATFDVGNVRLTTSLIEGEYPNYRQLIPDKYPNRLTMGKEPLLAAIRRVRLLAAESNNIRVKMSAEGVVLEAINQNLGQAEEDLDDVKYEGADMTVAFNPGYLSDGVEAVDSDTVVLETLDALKPAVVRSPESGEFTYLLMPVRVS
jgi:DNA polymerase-3 subunit beta